MENKKILLVFILMLNSLLFSCREFRSEKLEINYNKGYIKVLSKEYVVDSLVIGNHISKYYVIGLTDKSGGTNTIYFNNPNSDYQVFTDSLNYYCKQSPEVISPNFFAVIRKKGSIKTENENVQYFHYNKIPCSNSTVDTIEASSPYK